MANEVNIDDLVRVVKRFKSDCNLDRLQALLDRGSDAGAVAHVSKIRNQLLKSVGLACDRVAKRIQQREAMASPLIDHLNNLEAGATGSTESNP